jgi:hypothetical protein
MPQSPFDELARVKSSPVFLQPAPRRSLWLNKLAAALRWLHIYISLLGFTALMFFAVTGLTLNHPTWFGADQQHVAERQGEIPTEWLQLPGTLAVEGTEEIDYSRNVDRLMVVEHLRGKHGFRGAVSEFRVDERECLILFKGPGVMADVMIDRTTGAFTATQTSMGVVAILNDLHKGRDSGFAWSVLIDVSAVVTAVLSLTGIGLIFFLRRKRTSGLLTAVVGTIALIVVWYLGVP